MEYWLKCKFVITTSLNKSKTTLTLSIKIPLSLKLRKLRLMLIQFCIIFFCENIEQINDFHFALNKTRIKLVANLLENKFHDTYLEDKQYDKLEVKDVFKFNSEINIYVYFSLLEQILFEEIKNKASTRKHPLIKELLVSNYSDFFNNEDYNKHNSLLSVYIEKFSNFLI